MKDERIALSHSEFKTKAFVEKFNWHETNEEFEGKDEHYAS